MNSNDKIYRKWFKCVQMTLEKGQFLFLPQRYVSVMSTKTIIVTLYIHDNNKERLNLSRKILLIPFSNHGIDKTNFVYGNDKLGRFYQNCELNDSKCCDWRSSCFCAKSWSYSVWSYIAKCIISFTTFFSTTSQIASNRWANVA